MTALVGVACDGCGVRMIDYSHGQVSTTRVRQKAKLEGWHKTYLAGIARDICAMCWDRGER